MQAWLPAAAGSRPRQSQQPQARACWCREHSRQRRRQQRPACAGEDAFSAARTAQAGPARIALSPLAARGPAFPSRRRALPGPAAQLALSPESCRRRAAEWLPGPRLQWNQTQWNQTRQWLQERPLRVNWKQRQRPFAGPSAVWVLYYPLVYSNVARDRKRPRIGAARSPADVLDHHGLADAGRDESVSKQWRPLESNAAFGRMVRRGHLCALEPGFGCRAGTKARIRAPGKRRCRFPREDPLSESCGEEF